MVRFGLNLPKDDCQVSSIFVQMNLSVCFTDEFLPKFDLSKGCQTKELGPLPWSLTWGCQQLKRPGLPLLCENKRKKAGSFVSVKHRKRAWQTKEVVRKEPCA